MFSKTLILVLVGFSLALAQENFVNENIDIADLRSSISENFNQRGKTSIKDAYYEAVQDFKKIYEKLVDVEKNTPEPNREKFDELKVKYHKIKNEAVKKLREIQKAAIRIQEIAQVSRQVVHVGKDAVNKIGERMQRAAGEQIDQVKENLGQWEKEVDVFLSSDNITVCKEVEDKVDEKVDDKVDDKVDNDEGIITGIKDKFWDLAGKIGNLFG